MLRAIFANRIIRIFAKKIILFPFQVLTLDLLKINEKKNMCKFVKNIDKNNCYIKNCIKRDTSEREMIYVVRLYLPYMQAGVDCVE